MPSGAGAFPLHTARRTSARDEVRRKRSPLFVVYVNPVPPVKRPSCSGPVHNAPISCIPLQSDHKMGSHRHRSRNPLQPSEGSVLLPQAPRLPTSDATNVRESIRNLRPPKEILRTKRTAAVRAVLRAAAFRAFGEKETRRAPADRTPRSRGAMAWSSLPSPPKTRSGQTEIVRPGIRTPAAPRRAGGLRFRRSASKRQLEEDSWLSVFFSVPSRCSLSP